MILDMGELAKIIEINNKKETYGLITGHFDPIHIGHIRMIREAKKYCGKLIVSVNGDSSTSAKKGKPFMLDVERVEVIDAIKGVDYAVVYPGGTKDSIEVITTLKPNVFIKGGGEYSSANLPEWDICQRLNIKVFFNVGKGGKIQSSSDLINNSKK